MFLLSPLSLSLHILYMCLCVLFMCIVYVCVLYVCIVYVYVTRVQVMSAQCWCYTCGGKIVCRNTFRAHGRKSRPDSPERKVEEVGVDVSVSDPQVEMEQSSSDEEEPEEEEDITNPLQSLFEADNGAAIGQGNLTVTDVVLRFLDWVSSHKLTDKAAEDIWRVIVALTPEESGLPTWHTIKGWLRDAEGTVCTRYDICPNDCIAYYNSVNLPLAQKYRHAHRTRCPVCGTPRYLHDPADGGRRAAKQVFHFPVAPFIKSLFGRSDLVPYILTDTGDFPEGHVTNSRGWKVKMIDNPHMNKDHRNIGLIATTDGVPLFEDQRRSAWPIVYRVANLPDGLSTRASNCHLAMMTASEYLELDQASNKLRRVIRQPKTLKPHLTIIVDDLLGAYQRGT